MSKKQLVNKRKSLALSRLAVQRPQRYYLYEVKENNQCGTAQKENEVKIMCTVKYVVQRQMLGAREQGYALWNGKEIVEMTANEIKAALKRNEPVHGLEIGADGELTLDKKFFTRNIMEHRQCNNYKPMLESDDNVANVFYIVMGKNSNEEYEAVSSKFERTTLSEEKLKLYMELGIVSAGAKLEDGKVILPNDMDLMKEDAKVIKEEKKTVKPETATKTAKA